MFQKPDPFREFLEGMKKSSIPAEVILAVALDIMTDANPARLKAEYESDFAVQILMSPEPGPFEIPDENADGMLRFALAEDGKPVGINPDECHFLIAGQTGTGKSTLLKIIFAQAILLNSMQEERERKKHGKNYLLAVR